HTVAMGGRDTVARERLLDAGLSIRAAKNGSESWRYESCFSDYGRASATVDRIRDTVPVSVRAVARLGTGNGGKNTLPFTPAASIRPGMVMFTATGDFELVTSVRRVPLGGTVHDIDVEDTHNFIAGGLVTHNSIYGFRGADITNILNFGEDYPDAHVVKL